MPDERLGEKAIFNLANSIESTNVRNEYLEQVCGDQPELRGRVATLLRMQAEEPGFLEGPAARIAATVHGAEDRELLGTLIGPYKLLEQIGEGGMGLVYMAEQQQPVRRLVALKVVKPGMDSKQVIARFEAERQALAMMDHPNIAKVHDAGTTETGRPYFVMELVRGIPINEFCDQQKLTVGHRLELFIQACQAVQHAHQKGIIHRDLKPTNVLVTKADTVPLPKVIDFGIVKALGPSLTDHTLHTGFAQLVGTPMYMSPEQAEMNHFGVDTRSDVYSLGVLLYELLTGTTPFDKETLSKAGLDEVRRMIREDDPPRPSERISTLNAQALSTISQQRNIEPHYITAAIRGELDWIVMKALEKDRSRRYESVSALAADIQRYVSDEPVLACPPTAMYRFQKFARKHQPALATAAAIAACLILGTTVSAWQAVRATTAEAQANTNEQKAIASAAAAREKAQEATQQRDEAQRQRDEVKSLADRLQRTLYTANIHLAQSAWGDSNIGHMDDLLNQVRPKPGEADLRGFEWHFLNRLCHPEVLTLKAFNEYVNGVAYSPDGRRLAAAGGVRNGTTNDAGEEIKIWDAQTGQELLVLKLKGDDRLGLAFSPDGKRLAAGCGTWDDVNSNYTAGRVRVWDVQSGEELLSIKAHANAVSLVAFSPDGKRLASAGSTWNAESKKLDSASDEIKVWDAQTGQELLTFKGGGDRGLAFSRDGKRLFGANGKAAKVWDADSGQELFSIETEERDAAFSADGKRVATAGKILDVDNGTELLNLKWYGEEFSSVIFSPDARRLASVRGDGSRIVQVWDAETGAELFAFRGHSNFVAGLAFSPDGNRLASASSDGTVKIWDTTTKQDDRTFDGIANTDHTVAITPDGQRFAARIRIPDGDKQKADLPVELRVWEVPSGRELVSIKGLPKAKAGFVAFSPDGKRLAQADNSAVKVWDSESGREIFSLLGHADNVSSLSFSPDGKLLAGSGRDTKTVKVWNAETGQELLSLIGHANMLSSVAFSPDGKRLASACVGRTVKLWDVQTGRELLSFRGGGDWGLVFSPDGKRLAGTINPSLYGPGEIKVWDTATGQEFLALHGHTFRVSSVAFSPDGKRLASGSGHPTRDRVREVKMWDAETGQELLTLKVSNFPRVVAFSPDGQRLFVTVGPNGLSTFDATPLPENP